MENVTFDDSNSSGVTWAAVIAGAFVAAALFLALLALGTGIGFSSVSPWAGAGASASAVGWSAILWLVLMQLLSSSTGGYIAGRLRTKWVRVHTHEVYFRDTAHGFLVWAVGIVITTAFLTSAATSLVGGVARSSGAATEASRVVPSGPNGYFADMLLRTTTSASSGDYPAVRSETELILAHALSQGAMPAVDKSYLVQVVVARTGLHEPEADKRVDDVYAQFQEAADKARKAIAHSMYWTFLALLVGAFCASLAATIGGRQRDHVPAI
jgi:hypothetical protein